MKKSTLLQHLVGCSLFAVLSLALTPACQAGFVYSCFPRAEQLALNGRAALTPETQLRVANNTGPLAAGSAFFTQKVDVVNGFSSEFEFRIHSPMSSLGMADGMTFMIQNAPQGTAALGGGGGNLGYTNLSNNVVVEFDLFELQPNSAHIAVHSRGTLLNSAGDFARIGPVVPTPQLMDQQVHTARVLYSPGTLSVLLDGQPVLSRGIDLSSLLALDAGKAYVGFTAGVATGNANFDISRWEFLNSEPTVDLIGKTIPEPGSVTLAALGVGLLVARRYRLGRQVR
jgi:hypothetical protein